MKLNFRIIAKAGLLLVVFGFFMPVACSMNGFELARSMDSFGKTSIAIGLYVVFFAALAGCVIGALLLANRNVSSTLDWICVLASIGGGLFFIVPSSGNGNSVSFQSGAYVILVGWIIAVVGQLLYRTDKKEFSFTNFVPAPPQKTRVDKTAGTAGHHFCTHCGKPLNTGNNFCPSCGAKVNK